MAKKRQAAAVDPTSPPLTIQLGDQELKLTFDYAALAFAEEKLRQQGHNVNLLQALGDLNMNTLPILITAAALHYQPDTKLEDIRSKVTMGNLLAARDVVLIAWLAAMPESDRPKIEPDGDPANAENQNP
jgi:hypothetical protein